MAEVHSIGFADTAEEVASAVFPPENPVQPSAKVPKRMGRPPNPEKANIPHLPKPPGFKPPAIKFCKYWQEIEKQFPSRVTVYAYRTYPIIDRDKSGKPRYIDIITEPIQCDSIQDVEAELLHRWGSGVYRLILNDSAFSKGVCETRITIDSPDHPPLVDVDELVLTHPGNREFIDSLRRRNVRLPGEEAKGDDVGNEALAAMVGTNERLTEQVIELASRRESPPAVTLPSASNNLESRAAEMSLDTLARGVEMSNRMVESATQKVADITSQLASKRGDPLETVKQVMELAKSMQPPKDDSAMTALMEANKQITAQLFAMQTERTAELSRELAAMRSTQLIQAQGPAVTPQTFQPQMIDQFDRFLTLAEKLKSSLGVGGGAEETEARPGKGSDNVWLQLLPIALPMVTGIFGMISNIVYNYAASKTGQQPAPPPPPPAQAMTAEQMAAMAAGQPMEQLGQEPQQNGGNVYAEMLPKLEKPLRKALDNCSLEDAPQAGASFAYLIIEWGERSDYDMLRELGKQTVISLLQTYPPIWNYVVRIPSKFDRFLDGFMDADNLMRDDEPEEPEVLQPVAVPPVVKMKKPKTIEVTAEVVTPPAG